MSVVDLTPAELAHVGTADRRTHIDRREPDRERLLSASVSINELGVRSGRIRMREDVIRALRSAGLYDAVEVVMQVSL